MYYADLTPFDYNSCYTGLSVGWLDAVHPFPTGTVAAGFLDALFAVIASGDFTRCAAAGVHLCELCESRQAVYERNGQEIVVGDAEIAVPQEGIEYVAPTLIYHYVEAHHYLPPEPFVQGVLAAAARAADQSRVDQANLPSGTDDAERLGRW